MTAFRRIAVATDLGSSSTQAVDVAIDLAKDEQALLTLIHVFEIPTWGFEPAMYTSTDFTRTMERGAEELLEAERARACRSYAPTASMFVRGIAEEEIVRAIATLESDLLVVGSHGRHGLSRLYVGSVAETLVRRAPLPVLVVRETLSTKRSAA